MTTNDKIRPNNKVLFFVIVIFAITLCVSLHNNNKLANDNKELSNLYPIAQSELEKTINSKGILENKTKVLETTNVKLLKELQSKDESIIKLKQQVEYYKNKLSSGSSVTVVTTETNASGSNVNEPIEYTFDCDSTFPIYKSNIKNFGEWITGNVIASKDSTSINLKIKNDFNIVIGEEKQGFLKPKKPIAIITNENPYTDVKDMKVYRVAIKPKHTARNIGIGVLTGFTTGLIIGLTR